ncbi:hypothetical protein BDR04DRAFT_1091717 [Suillus decipiens]|nr:hypothetical protein BDR04DRAFT_1091717 [Suillus decipiens]
MLQRCIRDCVRFNESYYDTRCLPLVRIMLKSRFRSNFSKYWSYPRIFPFLHLLSDTYDPSDHLFALGATIFMGVYV